jgi:glyoxylate reductase
LENEVKCKVFVTSSIYKDLLSVLDSSRYSITVREDGQPVLCEKDLIAIAKNYDVLVTNITNKVTKNVLNNASRLKLISNMAIGHDNIDLESACENKIYVATTPDSLSRSVAEFTVGLLLMASKKVSLHQSLQRDSTYPLWSPTFETGFEINAKNVGIIGMGKIGKEIGEILHFGFNCNIHFMKHITSPQLSYPATPLNKDEFLRTQNIIILACPLNKSTYHLIDSPEILKMPEATTLINISRGEVINQEILIKNADKFHAIALDVTSPDPLPRNHSLLSNEKFFITPHIASATIEARRKMTKIALSNIHEFNNLGPDSMVNIINHFDLNN